jgi:hypothetical protein
VRVYYSIPLERSVQADAVVAMFDVVVHALHNAKALRINCAYKRVDDARNYIAGMFYEHSKDDDDVLVMLDNDHIHPKNIVAHLAEKCDAEHEVVGALMFRRSLPHDPCFYTLDDEGKSKDVALSFDGKSLVKCDIVGTGAIAIRRSAFRKLAEAGFDWPWFRFIYQPGLENKIQRSEDWNFGLECKRVGIPHWCDMSIMSPHIGTNLIGPNEWLAVVQEGLKDPEKFAQDFKEIGLHFKPKEEAAA